MSSSWNLVIPVLLLGLAVGGVLVALWRRGRSNAAGEDRDKALELADLEARQRDLYDQLRGASDSDREALELQAARNLKRIEELAGKLPRPREASEPAAEVREPGSTPRPPARSSALLGFAGGVACAALIGMLVVWAGRDAKPRPDDGGGAAPMENPHPPGGELDPRAAEALEQLARQVESDPTDLMARKQYAIGLLSTGQFFPAFEQAEILLGSDANDLDGLYVAGMVRMRMGQEGQAEDLLQRVVAGFPQHVAALTALGVLQLERGGLEAAEEYWQRALEASGGRNPEVERLIAEARKQFQAAGGEPPPTARPSSPPPPSAGPSYRLTLDLAPDAVARSGVLFVTLRKGDSGPPEAVKRIDRPSFPLELTISSADSMLGRPLPEEGTITARLDRDGSASTREEGEPEATVALRAGEEARLTLQ